MRAVLGMAVLGLLTVARAQTQAAFNQAAQSAQRLQNELDLLRQRVTELGNQQNALLTRATQARDDLVGGDLGQKETAQNDRLRLLRDQIRDQENVLQSLARLLAGETRQTDGHQDVIRRHTDLTTQLRLKDNEIGSLLNEGYDRLDEDYKTLKAELKQGAVELLKDLKTVADTQDGFEALLNGRLCQQKTIPVAVNHTSGAGFVTFVFNQTFAKPPSSFCALQGFLDKLSLKDKTHHPHPPPHGPHPAPAPEHGVVGVRVQCRASRDQMAVRVYDQSRARHNAVSFVYVQAKACAFE